jgi:trehalose synthase
MSDELRPVELAPRAIQPLAELLGPDRADRLTTAVRQLAVDGGHRTMWHVNATAAGGGVAELLAGLLGYIAAMGVDTRWSVIGGDDGFFDVTKRLHNLLHGADVGALSEADRSRYEEVSRRSGRALAAQVRPGDVVVLHDPQTAGIAEHLAGRGCAVVWRCHVGSDAASEASDRAWAFLRPYLKFVDAAVFSRAAYLPAVLPAAMCRVIPPSIDPLSVKNVPLDQGTAVAILQAAGVLDGAADRPAMFPRPDGGDGVVSSTAELVTEAPPDPAQPLVVQVSRWDRLKDMTGVMRAFTTGVPTGHLVLAGPQIGGVSDDPEEADVLDECRRAWRELAPGQRSRVTLALLPVADLDENAAIVNALQRHATVVAQKSLAEGFGLTVAEAMWKNRPVVAARVGGLADQITDGTGVLVDPHDGPAFAAAVTRLLTDPGHADAIGRAAHDRVYRAYLPDIHIRHWVDLVTALPR